MLKKTSCLIFFFIIKPKHLVGYFEHTVEPVIKELGANPSKDEWNKWVEKWSKFSIQSFLRSTEGQDGPWPEIAIQGYMVS